MTIFWTIAFGLGFIVGIIIFLTGILYYCCVLDADKDLSGNYFDEDLFLKMIVSLFILIVDFFFIKWTFIFFLGGLLELI